MADKSTSSEALRVPEVAEARLAVPEAGLLERSLLVPFFTAGFCLCLRRDLRTFFPDLFSEVPGVKRPLAPPEVPAIGTTGVTEDFVPISVFSFEGVDRGGLPESAFPVSGVGRAEAPEPPAPELPTRALTRTSGVRPDLSVSGPVRDTEGGFPDLSVSRLVRDTEGIVPDLSVSRLVRDTEAEVFPDLSGRPSGLGGFVEDEEAGLYASPAPTGAPEDEVAVGSPDPDRFLAEGDPDPEPFRAVRGQFPVPFTAHGTRRHCSGRRREDT